MSNSAGGASRLALGTLPFRGLCGMSHRERGPALFLLAARRQPSPAVPAKRTPHASPVPIDHDWLQARRRQILAAVANRLGQVRKSKVADDIDYFVHAFSGGQPDWEQVAPEDVFNWFCFLGTQGTGTTVVHLRSCPGVGFTGGSACAPGAACAKRYVAESPRTSFHSRLRMAYREQLARGMRGTPGISLEIRVMRR